jgi:hypothetical protein
MYGLNVAPRRYFIEIHGGGEVRFRYDGHVGAIEDGRVLQRLVFAFRYGE